MYRLNALEVKQFHGNRTITCDFDSGVNFLIGRNGSGKTHLINLIRSTISVDLHSIISIPFSYCRIQLVSIKDKRSKPSIIVKKVEEDSEIEIELRGSVFDERKYKIPVNFSRATRPVEWTGEFEFDEFEYRQRREIHPRARRTLANIREKIGAFLPFAWLPLQRYAGIQSHEEGSFQPIDAKLNTITGQLSDFITTLESHYTRELNKFQQTYLLSLFDGEYRSNSIIPPRFDFQKEQEAFFEIFRAFSIDKKEYTNRVSKFFKELKRDIDQFNESRGDPYLPIDTALRFGDANRAHRYIDRWKELELKREKIFDPRNVFLSILNRMMEGKDFTFDQRNHLVAFTGHGNPVHISDLSSGEKQMIILLTEALLQRNSPVLYIADEPELSLHLEWQTELVGSIRALNPEVQILFATHSPEILGAFGENAFDVGADFH